MPNNEQKSGKSSSVLEQEQDRSIQQQAQDPGRNQSTENSQNQPGRNRSNSVEAPDDEDMGVEMEAHGDEDQDDEVRATEEEDDAIESQRQTKPGQNQGGNNKQARAGESMQASKDKQGQDSQVKRQSER